VKVLELARHVGQRRQAVGVQIFVLGSMITFCKKKIFLRRSWPKFTAIRNFFLLKKPKIIIMTYTPGSNPTIASYNASAVKIYNAKSNQVHSEVVNSDVVRLAPVVQIGKNISY
jgi:hypothetical protein